MATNVPTSTSESSNVTTDQRIDALHGVPVIVAAHRQHRPNLPSQGCPFCVGGLEAPEPYEVRWFPNRWPTLGQGRAEVVLFSPDHEQSLGGLGPVHLRAVVDLWAQRTQVLGSRHDVSYVLIFENRGAEVGATIHHPHGQIYAFGDIPPVPKRELDLAASRGTCALCAPCASELVVARRGAGDNEWTSRVPHASGHPFGMLVAPTAHVPDLVALSSKGRDAMAAALGDAIGRLDAHFDEATPYMLWMHQRPTDGGEWPHAHLHLEIVPFRRAPGVNRYIAAAELGSGTLINSVDPADAASALRAARPLAPPTSERTAP